MIIECEQCRSKFNFDESLLKRDGSRVRCSVCKTIFTAYPPEPDLPKETAPGRMEMEETVALDSPPILAERDGSSSEDANKADFDKEFEQALDEQPPVAVSPDQAPRETAESLEGASKTEEESAAEDLEGEEKERERPAKRRSFSALSAVLIIVLLLIAGAAAVYFYAPDILPESLSFLKPAQKQDVSDTGVARLSFGNVKGGFVQSEKEGQLFVIQGVITNNYPKPRSAILVKGSLLDDKGQAVKSKMAYAGNALTEDQIKTMPLADINNELKNRLGRQDVNANVKPETAVPFTIVIENLPENLSEFTVEAVSSSPAQPQ